MDSHSENAKIESFVSTVLTEDRLQQGVDEVCNGLYQVCAVGSLMTWIQRKIQAECKQEFLAAGLTWEQLQKPILETTRKWYLNQT